MTFTCTRQRKLQNPILPIGQNAILSRFLITFDQMVKSQRFVRGRPGSLIELSTWSCLEIRMQDEFAL